MKSLRRVIAAQCCPGHPVSIISSISSPDVEAGRGMEGKLYSVRARDWRAPLMRTITLLLASSSTLLTCARNPSTSTTPPAHPHSSS